MQVRRALIGLVGLAILVGALLPLPAQVHQLSARATAARQLAVVQGVPQLAALPSTTPEFLAAVRARVDQRAKLRLLVNSDGTGRGMCDPAPGQFYWLAYQLLPRVAVCDASAKWWLLYRTTDVPLPPGSMVAVDLAAGLRLVDTRPGDAA